MERRRSNHCDSNIRISRLYYVTGERTASNNSKRACSRIVLRIDQGNNNNSNSAPRGKVLSEKISYCNFLQGGINGRGERGNFNGVYEYFKSKGSGGNDDLWRDGDLQFSRRQENARCGA